MTTAEAQFFKDYIDEKILELLSIKSDEDKDILKIQSFAQRYMQTITGQEYLPQTVFRLFLEEFCRITCNSPSDGEGDGCTCDYEEATEDDIIMLFESYILMRDPNTDEEFALIRSEENDFLLEDENYNQSVDRYVYAWEGNGSVYYTISVSPEVGDMVFTAAEIDVAYAITSGASRFNFLREHHNGDWFVSLFSEANDIGGDNDTCDIADITDSDISSLFP